MNSTFNANSGAHTLTHDKIIKSPYKLTICLQTRTEEVIKKVFKKCKLYLKIRPDQVTTFTSKIGFPKIILLVPFISFSVDSAMSPIMMNVLNT